MRETRTVIDNYIAMWNEDEPEKRRRPITETLADDAMYLDPLMNGEGTDAIRQEPGSDLSAHARGARDHLAGSAWRSVHES